MVSHAGRAMIPFLGINAENGMHAAAPKHPTRVYKGGFPVLQGEYKI
jgi:hypothetical protein